MATKKSETAAPPGAAKAKALRDRWIAEIQKALKREKKFRKRGSGVSKLYDLEDGGRVPPFNILYSNTETMLPALFSATPRPRVKRRFDDQDPAGAAAAVMMRRVLEYLLDTDIRDFDTYSDLMEESVRTALVAGRGIARFKYDAVLATDDDAGGERVESETVVGEIVPWNRFLHGYARRWKDVPWVAFERGMTKEEVEKNFGREVLPRCSWVDVEAESPSDKEEGGKKLEESTTEGIWVYEVWDKLTRQVLFISENFDTGVLRVTEDPFRLSGFFPCPEPLSLVKRVGKLDPVPLYVYYQEQAEELNDVTQRIRRIVRALKVRGFYDTTVEGIGQLLEAEDNTLLPADNVAAMQQGQTLDKAIFLMPIDKLITVLQQLYAQRQQIKQVIYEITGIADIMRGSSQASETLGAQQLKTQWGAVRLKKLQRRVETFARDSLRIMAEIAVTNLSADTVQQMTQMPLPRQEERRQALMVAQQLQAAGQQIPPEVQSILSGPSLDDVLALLQNDLQRSYRIDVETNSTLAVEATEDKEDMAELMNAIAQFLNGVAPAVQQGVLPFEAAKALLLGIVRKFRFGEEVEALLQNMQPPQPPESEGGNGEADAAKAEADMAVAQAKAQSAMMQEQIKQQTLQLEAQVKQAELRNKMTELDQKAQLAAMQFAAKVAQLRMKPAGISQS